MAKDAAYKQAEEKIQQALKSGATELDLCDMKLTELPESIGQLKQLTSLNLNSNQLTTLPDSLGLLSQLDSLALGGNQLLSLPQTLTNLKKIQKLWIRGLKFQPLPNWIAAMKSLRMIDLAENNLTVLPDSICKLEQLTEIGLSSNYLTSLPPSLAHLEHLEKLDLDDNPLNPALQSAYKQGLDAVKAYLRSLEQNAEPLYEAKLVLVGEGNVGKTTRLKAMKGSRDEAPRKNEPTTHGVEIDIHGLCLPHPTKYGIEIQLNAWDFGGQEVYRVTQKAEGILPDGRLTQVWHDHAFKDEPRYAPALYPFFLRLMEKYDVSYRLPDGKASLVAQHAPQVRPELLWLPDQEPPANLRRIAMICAMEEDPPGLVPWMIVRTHDYATGKDNHRLHWQKGMFLSYEPHGEAMLEKRGREFHIYTQSECPEYFLNVIHYYKAYTSSIPDVIPAA